MTTATMFADKITNGEVIMWQDRIWSPMTQAMTPDEMYAHLRIAYFPYDSETAHSMSTGGTFDVTRWPADADNGEYRTYTVANAHAGLVRLYRATDTRTLKNGEIW